MWWLQKSFEISLLHLSVPSCVVTSDKETYLAYKVFGRLHSQWFHFSKLRLQGNTFARLTHLSSFLRADGLMQWLVLSRSHSPTTWMPNTMALLLLEHYRSYLRLSLTPAQAIFGFQARIVTSLTLLVFFTTNTTLVDPHLTRWLLQSNYIFN